jgi:hypothetical protein
VSPVCVCCRHSCSCRRGHADSVRILTKACRHLWSGDKPAAGILVHDRQLPVHGALLHSVQKTFWEVPSAVSHGAHHSHSQCPMAGILEESSTAASYRLMNCFTSGTSKFNFRNCSQIQRVYGHRTAQRSLRHVLARAISLLM